MKYVAFVVCMMAAAFVMLLAGLRIPTPIALAMLILAVSMDFLTTYLCLKQGRKEGNPVIAFLFKKLTVFGTFGLLACIWVLFIVFRWLPSSNGIQTAVACVYWVVPVNNLIVLMKAIKANRANKANRENHAMQDC